MAVSTPGELFSALASGNFSDLLGTEECDWLDFKRDPYHLDSQRQKWELAKDVSALANADGGALVVGVEAKRRTDEISDRATSITGVSRTLIDPDRYRQVIAEGLWPSISVSMYWRSSPNSASPAGPATVWLFVIEVPRVADEQRYVVMRKLMDEDDRRVEGVGIAQRRGDITHWFTAEEVQRLVADGLASHRFSPQPSVPTTEEIVARADARLNWIDDTLGWHEDPALYLQALPPPQTNLLLSMHTSDGVRGSLEHIDRLRPMGFGLPTMSVTVVDGGLASLAESRRALVIEADGLFTAAGVATFDFFAWASKQYKSDDEKYRLNPVPLVEFTLEFARFLANHLMDAAGANEGWRLRVVARRLLTAGPVGLQGRTFTFPPALELYEGHLPSVDDRVSELFPATGHPGQDAYSLLLRLYNWFGVPPSLIPYSENSAVIERLVREIV